VDILVNSIFKDIFGGDASLWSNCGQEKSPSNRRDKGFSSKLGEKSGSPGNGTVYHPHFVEFQRTG